MTQFLAQEAGLTLVLFVLPFTGFCISSQRGSEGKGPNKENRSTTYVPTQHAQRLSGKLQSPSPSFVATATPSSPDS